MSNESQQNEPQVLNLMDKIAEKNIAEFCKKHGINRNENLHEQMARIFCTKDQEGATNID